MCDIFFLLKVELYKQKLDGEISSTKRIEELEQKTAEYEKQKVISMYDRLRPCLRVTFLARYCLTLCQ